MGLVLYIEKLAICGTVYVPRVHILSWHTNYIIKLDQLTIYMNSSNNNNIVLLIY